MRLQLLSVYFWQCNCKIQSIKKMKKLLFNVTSPTHTHTRGGHTVFSLWGLLMLMSAFMLFYTLLSAWYYLIHGAGSFKTSWDVSHAFSRSAQLMCEISARLLVGNTSIVSENKSSMIYSQPSLATFEIMTKLVISTVWMEQILIWK